MPHRPSHQLRQMPPETRQEKKGRKYTFLVVQFNGLPPTRLVILQLLKGLYLSGSGRKGEMWSKTSTQDKIKLRKFQSGGNTVKRRARGERRNIICKKTPYSQHLTPGTTATWHTIYLQVKMLIKYTYIS